MNEAMPSPDGVSVALPIFRAEPDTLRRAAGSIQTQTLADLDILMVLNGADDATTGVAHEIARQDARVRIAELPDPNLAAALNVALRLARFPIVARMDADDLCPPRRLELQARWLREHPEVAALGTAFERISADDRVID